MHLSAIAYFDNGDAMIIDAHVHIKGGDIYRREFPPELIIKRMNEAGIDRSVVFSICLPSKESNELTFKAVSRFPDKLIGFAHVLPQEGDVAVLELERAIMELGFKGLKLHAGEFAQECGFTVKLLEPVLERAVKLKIPVLLDPISKFEPILEMVNAFPELKLIIAHLGSHNNEVVVSKFIGLASKHENLYLDTSWSDIPWKIKEAVEYAGADKLIFGSDGPLYHPLVELTKIKVLKLSKEEEEMILGKNLLRLLRT